MRKTKNRPWHHIDPMFFPLKYGDPRKKNVLEIGANARNCTSEDATQPYRTKPFFFERPMEEGKSSALIMSDCCPVVYI
ncbi:MAG TPA: hypothetical protein VGO47_05625 [Chlamydiales bacterium]|nr:hypothetical protein [Chlamydiales bacterium]